MERIAIIGTGLIGRAWAMVFARAGHSVTIWDNEPGAVVKALALIEESLREQKHFGLISEEPQRVRERISAATTMEQALAEADYVQENTAERVDVKKQVYGQMDALARPQCILASSTSTIPASVFSQGLPGRHRCIVAHPVNPPHVVPVVELCPAPWTAPEVVQRSRTLQEGAGQVPILVKKEIRGFILNRLQAALLMEAWWLVQEDYCSVDDLDKTIKDGLGLRWSFMGPFETIDLNAPGGVIDYAGRYGGLLYETMTSGRYQPWDDALIAKIDAERRKVLPQAQHGKREAWRDRQLMALIAHKRALAAEE